MTTSSFRTLIALLGTVPVVAPASLLAQDSADDWSRVIHHRECWPTTTCTPRAGMLWDSTNIPPAYPEVFRAVMLGGEAEIAFHVRADGRVDPASVQVVRASHPVFQRAALDAASRWRFGTERDGRPTEPVPVRMQLVFAHEGVCAAPGPRPRVGRAADYQLVIITCAGASPRAEVPGDDGSRWSTDQRATGPATSEGS